MPAEPKTPGQVAYIAHAHALVKETGIGTHTWWSSLPEHEVKVWEKTAQAVRKQLEAEQADVDPREDLPGTLRRARKIVRAWRDNLPFESPADARDNATEALEDVEALLD